METSFDQATGEQERSDGKMTGDLENIKTSFAQLRRDVMELLTSAFGLGRTGAGVARDGANDAVESLKARLTDLKDRGTEQFSAVERKIEANPLPSALIAFGVGFVIAKILTRR